MGHTAVYAKLREQIQSLFDFAVVVCHGVPAVKRNIGLLNKGVIASLPKPDYFPDKTTSTNQLLAQATGYRQQLARHLILAAFSFFEAFVKDAMREMIAFHGGPENLIVLAERHEEKFLRVQRPAHQGSSSVSRVLVGR